MIPYLSRWIKNIIYIIFFIVFLEILIPNNSMRKYVKIVAGLLVMVVILSPIVGLMNKNHDLQSLIEKSFIEIEQLDFKGSNEIFSEKQNNITMEIYKEKIQNKIKVQVENLIEEVRAQVEVEVYKEHSDENFGNIKKVNLFLYKKDKILEEEDVKQNINSEVQPIKNVEIIGESAEKKNDESIFHIPIEKEEEIKEYIFSFYNVPLQNILINKQKNNLEGEEKS